MKRKIVFMFVNGDIKEAQRTVMDVGANGEMIIIGVGNYAMACEEALKAADEGAKCIELCGGFGTIGHARVTEAVEGKCPVGVVRFDNHPGYDGASGDTKWM
ncbi:DUF6506 family protein [Bacilliculturomica massiliensis]|uniref:DUF6506 family protein n=1 Tax=Bacilliculturomica massiliensis TaxID=1917867 RepID=UPI001031DA13|nr:DUF6506 family protein [Bacilliculturomica massiliensis]